METNNSQRGLETIALLLSGIMRLNRFDLGLASRGNAEGFEEQCSGLREVGEWGQ